MNNFNSESIRGRFYTVYTGWLPCGKRFLCHQKYQLNQSIVFRRSVLVQEKKENAGRRFYARVEEQFVLDGFPET
jgi:hypothetical protein